MPYEDALPPSLKRSEGTCINITITKPEGDGEKEIPLLAYSIDENTKGMSIQWVQRNDDSPWTTIELIKHEYELATQQSIESIPWINFTGGIVNRRSKQAVMTAVQFSDAAATGRHSFLPDCSGWKYVREGNRLLLLAEKVASKEAVRVDVDGYQMDNLALMRLHQIAVIF